MRVTPEMVLGKDVVTSAGRRVGEIVDVGVHEYSRVKFLVVGDGARHDFVRYNVELIGEIDGGSVVLKA